MLLESIKPLNSFIPSKFDLEVLSLIITSETMDIALSLIQKNSNRVFSLQKLIKYGYVDQTGLTEQGQQLVSNQALVDGDQPNDRTKKIVDNINKEQL